MSRLKIVSGLPYKIVIESWNTHASSSSQEALLWKAAAWGSREKALKRERSQSVPFTLPASYSPFQGSVCVFYVSHRNSTTSLRVETLPTYLNDFNSSFRHENEKGKPPTSISGLFSSFFDLKWLRCIWGDILNYSNITCHTKQISVVLNCP